MKYKLAIIIVLISLLLIPTNVSAEDVEAPDISIISDRQFVDTTSAHVLMGDTFYIWQSYGKIRMTYMDGNITLMDTVTARGVTKIALVEGAHLQVYYNGSLLVDIYTHRDNFENFFKYQVSGVNALAITAVITVLMACLFEYLYWYKYIRRLV